MSGDGHGSPGHRHHHDHDHHRHEHAGVSRRRAIGGAGAAALMAAVPGTGFAQLHQATGMMAARAGAFLDTLGSTQRERAHFGFDAAERFDWHYVPRRRPGLPMRDMNGPQRGAAMALLEFALSEGGYRKATGIMALETVLRRIETFGFSRDPENYAFCVFGAPPALPWGWRVEGHHLSLTFTAITAELVAVTPAFTGANPAIVPDGPEKGMQVLAGEQRLARELMLALDAPARQRAIIADRALGDIVSGPGRADALRAPAGIALGALPEGQRDLAMTLIGEYVGNMRADFAAAQWQRIRDAGIAGIRFAWAGSLDPGRASYYRLHGPTLLIEHDNSQNDANHIHAVWRDPSNDFGRDALRLHYEQGGHHHHGRGA